MNGRIESLVEEHIKFVRVGNQYIIGPQSHKNLAGTLLGLEDEINHETFINMEFGEIDMGILTRDVNDKVMVTGFSYSLHFPDSEQDYEPIRTRTKELLERDYPGEVFEIGAP